VLSQGVVLQYVAVNVRIITEMIDFWKIDKLGELGDETIDKLGFGKARTIIRAKENDNVLEVLQMIVSNNISAVPIIGFENRIIGNISITDLKV
jgi:CBS domain-containing protein